MREDLNEALDVALRENLRRDEFRGNRIHQEVTSKRRAIFIARLRLFLLNVPDELSIQDLREAIE
jgi:hypothetical protein